MLHFLSLASCYFISGQSRGANLSGTFLDTPAGRFSFRVCLCTRARGCVCRTSWGLSNATDFINKADIDEPTCLHTRGRAHVHVDYRESVREIESEYSLVCLRDIKITWTRRLHIKFSFPRGFLVAHPLGSLTSLKSL